MARLFLMSSLLNEAHSLDLYNSRAQAYNIRDLQIFNRHRDFVQNYRLSEDLIDSLLSDINHLMKAPRRRRRGLSVKVKLLCALAFFGTGSYQKICGKDINLFMSQPSVSRCIQEVVEVLAHPSVIKKYIRFPQNSLERLKLKERFFQKYNIPGVIGCIDGTFVTMIRPQQNEERFFCRKGNHARNIQLITDADLNILHVDTTFGGATHDSFIFNSSCIRYHLEELANAGENVYLLGDSGYAQRSYLMIPVPNAVERTPAGLYNKLHMTARNSVERVIGMLKGRFRCLLVHRVLHYHPDTVAKIVVTCCVLQNICNRAGLPAPALQARELQEEIYFRTAARRQSIPEMNATEQTIGQSSRLDLINTLWRAQNTSF